MDSEIAGYLATACGIGFVVASFLAVLADVKLSRSERKYKRVLGDLRMDEIRLRRETNAQSESNGK